MTASVPGKSSQSVETRGKKTFPRAARLLRHADFERVYKEGRRHFSPSMTVFYLAKPTRETGGMRVGFTVGRALGGAVERNRMKRRLREAVRLTRPTPGPSADVVINPKKSLLKTDFADVVGEVRRALDVVEKNSRESRVPGSEQRSRNPEG